MYMFFWFFKQLYYNLKRFTKHKFLLLLVFFVIAIFLFVNPIFATDYITIESNVSGNSNSYNLPSFSTLPSDATNLINNGKPYIIRKWTESGRTTYYLYIINSANGYFYHKSNQSASIVHNVNAIYGCLYNEGTSYEWHNTTGIASSVELNNVIYYGGIIYGDINKNTIYFNPFVEPYISTSSSSISSWSFDNLIINCGDCDPSSTFWLECNYEGYTFDIDVDDYISVNNGIAIISIPKYVLNESIVLRNGFEFGFNLQVRQPNMQVLYYQLGSYTLILDTQQQQEINEDSNKQLLSDINKNQQQTTQAIDNLNNSQQETTNAINDLNNTITDDNIQNSSIYLPSDTSNDITQDGLNGIFTSIYNAFCTGQAQDIVFPIPFTNKNITLQANYLRQMLTNSGATWVITIIESFWWYLISRFIIKDISNKITKIKSGNIEDIENSNIKGDML